jgi:hypothetical protein
MADWTAVKNEVESNGGVKTFQMERLRDAFGAGRLGTIVCEEISRELAGIGLGHIPEVLPTYQTEPVRIYRRGSLLAEVIDIILKPGEKNDTELLTRFGKTDLNHADTIAKIRELVSV